MTLSYAHGASGVPLLGETIGANLEYALRQSGCRLLIAAPSFKTSDYAAMVEEVRPRLPALERTAFLGSGEWDGLLSAGERVPIDRLRAREAELEFDDAINIQY